jgi:hypothetical protein
MPRRLLKKKRRKANDTRLSPINRFVNILFPETTTYEGEHISQEKKVKRLAAKEKFEWWIRCGEPWARMFRRFGYGIILLVSNKLSNEKFLFSASDAYCYTNRYLAFEGYLGLI